VAQKLYGDAVKDKCKISKLESTLKIVLLQTSLLLDFAKHKVWFKVHDWAQTYSRTKSTATQWKIWIEFSPNSAQF